MVAKKFLGLEILFKQLNLVSNLEEGVSSLHFLASRFCLDDLVNQAISGSISLTGLSDYWS